MNQDLQSTDATYCTLLELFENYERNEIIRFIQANFKSSYHQFSQIESSGKQGEAPIMNFQN